MNSLRRSIGGLAICCFILALAGVAQAQATRTWVSGVGDDANPCSRFAPCKTFAGTISKTAINGEINCLDPGSFGAVTITKSITIDCHEIFASVSHSSVNGIVIPFDNFTSPGEVRKTVRLRNLNLTGFDSGLVGINISGGIATTGTEVFVEDCLIDGDFGGNARGIQDFRAGGGVLVVDNTTVRNMGVTGISVVPATGTNGSLVSVTKSRVANCAFGLALANGAKGTTIDSVFVGNGTAVRADGVSQISVEHCTVSNNTVAGFFVSGGGSILVARSVAMNNAALATVSVAGTISSYGNNHTGGIAFPSLATPSS